MRNNRARLPLARSFGLAVLSIWAYSFAVAGPSYAASTQRLTSRPTVITVTAGKPSELAFSLSRSSLLPAGQVTFKVTNKGVLTHDFKICTSPTAAATKTSCVGKVTKMLAPGKSATLTVTLKRKGKYEYLCTVPGHAKSGMKGLIGIGVKVAPVAVVKTTTTTTTTTTAAPPTTSTTTTTTAAGGGTCASPVTTAITVKMFEYGFTLSQSSAPCGTLVFTEVNTGNLAHNFDINGHAGPMLNPGSPNATFSATLTPGTYTYVCDVPGHDELGMNGQFTVTSS